MTLENSPTQIMSGNRGLKVMAIVFATSYVVLAGTVGFLVYERIVGVNNNYSIAKETAGQLANDILDIKATQTEMNKDVAETCQNMKSKYRAIEMKISEMHNEVKDELAETREYYNTSYHELRVETNAHVDAINISHRELQFIVEILKEITDETKSSGTTYVRCGRTTCLGNGSDIVYSGYAGGSFYNHTGAAVSMLCLPMDPDWAQYSHESEYDSGLVYGSEYESWSNRKMDDFFGPGHVNQDVPCALSNVQPRSATIMVPGKTKCHPDWTLEYVGYLMSGHFHNAAATDYYCIDKKPENVVGGRGGINDDGRLLFFVEARCGSLKCPPYVHGRELTCVVCSK